MSVSPDLEYIAADADLVVLEGMVCASNDFFRGFDPYFFFGFHVSVFDDGFSNG